jgi:hypothetical protein
MNKSTEMLIILDENLEITPIGYTNDGLLTLAINGRKYSYHLKHGIDSARYAKIKTSLSTKNPYHHRKMLTVIQSEATRYLNHDTNVWKDGQSK